MRKLFMDFEELEKQYEYYQNFNSYNLIKLMCESKIVQKRWATHEMLDIDPYLYEKNSLTHGKWLDSSKGNVLKHYLHGFDSTEKIVAIYTEKPFGGNKRFDETFIAYSDDSTLVLSYQRSVEIGCALQSICWITLKNGVPLIVRKAHVLGYKNQEQFFYENNILKYSIREFQDCEYNAGAFPKKIRAGGSIKYEYKFDSLGSINLIVQTLIDNNMCGISKAQNVYKRKSK